MASAPQRTTSQRAVIKTPSVMEPMPSASHPSPSVGKGRMGMTAWPEAAGHCQKRTCHATFEMPRGELLRSELQRPRMADDDRSRFGRTARADLPEGGFHLVDEEINHVPGTLGPER